MGAKALGLGPAGVDGFTLFQQRHREDAKSLVFGIITPGQVKQGWIQGSLKGGRGPTKVFNVKYIYLM